MQGVKLSILICTIPERQPMFKELFNELSEQSKRCNSMVQVCWDDSPKGTITIGAKRNKLLDLALGDYVCFADDDDSVAPDYIESILKAIEKGTDCIGFKIKCYMEGKEENAASSMKYDWADNVDGFRYVRSIYHKTPVKRELALKAKFPHISNAEDKAYSEALNPYLNTETEITEPIYHYAYLTYNKEY